MTRFVAAALLAFAAVVPATAAQAGTGAACARTPGSIYWEVCVGRDGCRVYVWSTMPPALCV